MGHKRDFLFHRRRLSRHHLSQRSNFDQCRPALSSLKAWQQSKLARYGIKKFVNTHTCCIDPKAGRRMLGVPFLSLWALNQSGSWRGNGKMTCTQRSWISITKQTRPHSPLSWGLLRWNFISPSPSTRSSHVTLKPYCNISWADKAVQGTQINYFLLPSVEEKLSRDDIFNPSSLVRWLHLDNCNFLIVIWNWKKILF